MILQRLTQLAARKGLDNPTHEPIRAHGLVRIDRDGKLIELAELPKGTWLSLPREQLRQANIASQILWDKPAYLFGHPSKAGKKTKLAEKRKACLEIHQKLAQLCDTVRVAAAAKFLARKPYKSLAEQPEGNYVLYYEKDKVPIGSRKEIIPALRDIRLRELDIVGTGICPVTGLEDDLVTSNHAKIKPLPGTLASGGSLISFLPPSSWGWGHETTKNMVIGLRAFYGYTSALRYLLTHQRIHLTETATAVWWANADHPLESILRDMLDGKSDAAWEAFSALQELEGLEDVSVCFAVLLGAQGRAHVAHFVELSGQRVAAALLDHARRFFYGPEKGTLPSLRRILLSSTRPDTKRPLRNVRFAAALGLFRSAIGDGDPPPALAEGAMRELDRRLAVADDMQVCLDRVRMGAIGSSLDTKNGIECVNGHGFRILRTDAPYVLGSLFAVMEHVQVRAIPSVARNKRNGVAERWLREAKRHPSRVFPILQAGCRQHLIKMGKKRMSGWYYLDEVYLSVAGKIGAVPDRLEWADQGTFMLGYDHTRAALRWRATPIPPDASGQEAAQTEA